jgi:hypothetical protein
MKNKFFIGEEVTFLTSMGRCFSIALHPQLGKDECTGIKAKVIEVNIAMYDKGCFNPECMSGDCQISYSIELEGIPNKRVRVFEFELEKISDKEQENYNYEIGEVVTVRKSLYGRVGGIRKNDKGEVEYYIFCEESDSKWYSANAIKKGGIKNGNA